MADEFSPDDPLDLAARVSARALIGELSLYQGELSLLSRSFGRETKTPLCFTVYEPATLSSTKPTLAERSQTALSKISPKLVTDPKALAQAFLAASPQGNIEVPPRFEVITAARGAELLQEHVSRTQRSEIRRIPALLSLFSAARFRWWSLGDLHRSGMSTTALFIIEGDKVAKRALLLEYVGDGT